MPPPLSLLPHSLSSPMMLMLMVRAGVQRQDARQARAA
jgi:hypothetical protein